MPVLASCVAPRATVLEPKAPVLLDIGKAKQMKRSNRPLNPKP